MLAHPVVGVPGRSLELLSTVWGGMRTRGAEFESAPCGGPCPTPADRPLLGAARSLEQLLCMHLIHALRGHTIFVKRH